MKATQGVILVMLGALALYLIWSSKSPFNASTAPIPGVTPNPNGGTFGVPAKPGDTHAVPDNCVGSSNDYVCGTERWINGVLQAGHWTWTPSGIVNAGVISN